MSELEVWTTPAGVAVELRAVDFEPYVPADDEEDCGGWEWFPESAGARPPQRYLLVEVATGEVDLDRTVFPYAPWTAYDAISDVLLADGYEPPPLTEAELATCEHGLSASLCSGPNHYGED
jgi:hypothetical protein